MKRTIILAICTISAGIVPAVAETFDFSQPLTLSATQAAGAWYKDRYAPNGFASQSTAPDSTTNTLKESINVADAQSGSFYNTQGRKYDLASGENSATVSLYVESVWATQDNREAGFWGQSPTDANDTPIIEFQGAITDGLYQNGGVAGFYGWDGQTGAWHLITSAGFTYNSWATLNMTLTGVDTVTYTVNNDSLDAPTGGLTSLSNVMLQGYNSGSAGNSRTASYDIYWNDLSTTTTPEPGTVGTMFTGMGVLLLGLRSRRKALQQK
jgi:hypothetical protein